MFAGRLFHMTDIEYKGEVLANSVFSPGTARDRYIDPSLKFLTP